MPAPAPLSAAALFAPFAPADFFRDHWERRPLLLERARPGFYDSILTLADLDRHFQSRQLPAQYFRVMDRGVEIDRARWARHTRFQDGSALHVVEPERLLAAYTDGATLIVNHADGSLPSLGAFCRALRREWALASIQANLYLTPPGAQGFAAHFDRHCVLILQVHGEKTWRLRGSGAELPVEGHEKIFPRLTTPGPLEREFLLRAGDLLYLPRGHVHEALTSDSASLHITLGLYPRFGFELLDELRARAVASPALRRGFPLGPDAAPARAALRAELAAWLAAQDLAQLPTDAVGASRATGETGRFSDTVCAPLLTADSLLQRRAGVTFTSVRDGEQLLVTVGDQTVAAPALAAGAFAWLANRAEPFTPRQLPALLAPVRKVELARGLVRSGLLAIEKL
ncbi:MAG: hypothetical protein RLZZ15_2897 [Verrucomicrobiota bacterium]|jgi:ribosomal protein L16 Arg81 hydroxylase